MSDLAVEAAARALYGSPLPGLAALAWDDAPAHTRRLYAHAAKAAIAAFEVSRGEEARQEDGKHKDLPDPYATEPDASLVDDTPTTGGTSCGDDAKAAAGSVTGMTRLGSAENVETSGGSTPTRETNAPRTMAKGPNADRLLAKQIATEYARTHDFLSDHDVPRSTRTENVLFTLDERVRVLYERLTSDTNEPENEEPLPAPVSPSPNEGER